MRTRCAVLVAGVLVAVIPRWAEPAAKARAESRTWTPPRTADGDPDLEGTWTNSTVAPSEKRVADAREQTRLHSTDGPEYGSLWERCLTRGLPMRPGPYNNDFQIVQTPGYVVILHEMIHDARVIPLDGRPHVPPRIRKWMGDGRGHWEGDSLVVDTTNFSEKDNFRGSAQNLDLTERFTRVAPDEIRYEFMVDDPTTFTRPWTAPVPVSRAEGEIFEYACQEGNYARADILRGARAEEAAKKEN